METKFDFPTLVKQAQEAEDLIDCNIIDKYKSTYAWDINYRLNANEQLFPRHKEVILALDSAIHNAPRSDKINYVYRGLYNTDMALHDIKKTKNTHTLSDLFKNNIGETIFFRGYLSTTYHPPAAAQFSNGIILKIIIPDNFPFLAIDTMIESLNPWYSRSEGINESEDEILLPRGLYFYIKSIKNIILKKKEYNVITLDPRASQLPKRDDEGGGVAKNRRNITLDVKSDTMVGITIKVIDDICSNEVAYNSMVEGMKNHKFWKWVKEEKTCM